MRLVATNSIEEGSKIAKAIYNDSGKVLIQKGVTLSKNYINRLIALGITFVYIEDERIDDVVVEDIISDATRKDAVSTIKKEFINITEEMKLKKSFNGDHLSKSFSKVVKNILDDIKGNKEALSMLTDVMLYDNYIFTHSLNVTVYTLGLALQLKMSEKQLMEIGLGAMLHDVGKMLVPTEILNKPGKLSQEEFVEVKKHTMAGYTMLKDLPNIPLLTAHCALQHHERLDGSGYPQNLTGDKIHLYAKIIGIADVYDAVTTHRVYRRAMLPHEGMDLLYAGIGKLYDPDMIDAFRKTVAIYPVGISVGLSDGREGIVVKQNRDLSTHPVVRIFCENGKKLEMPYDLDLMLELNTTIVNCEPVLADSFK